MDRQQGSTEVTKYQEECAVLADLAAERGESELEFIHRFEAGQITKQRGGAWADVPGMKGWVIFAWCVEGIRIDPPWWADWYNYHWTEKDGWHRMKGGAAFTLNDGDKAYIYRVLRSFGIYKGW